jgi:error-prone DNA polymerase
MYLNCHSFYSMRYGTLSVNELVEEACEKRADVLALTDINNTSATFEFVRTCQEKGIKPIVGIEFRNGDELLFIGIAKNNEGFRELNKLLSIHNMRKKALPAHAPEMNDAYIIYPLGKKEPEALRDNEWLGIRIPELSRIPFSDLNKQQHKMVMLHPVTFKSKQGYNLHRLLRAVSKNTLLSKLTMEEQAMQDEIMLSADQLFGAYGRFQKIIKNTMDLADSCSIYFDGQNKSRKTFTGNLYDDKLLLEKLALDGLKHRYRRNNKAAQERVKKELEVIDRLGFNAYFLITWDILRYAKNRNFSFVGRGSGANSIIAYCLGITEVDPIELDLYFERFLNPHRTSPPDFDIDFSWKDRDDVTDYVFKRYGNEHTALLATYSTFRGKSIIRELGKVFGLPKPEIDNILTLHDPSKLKDKDQIVKTMFHYGKLMEDFPNYLSIHAGGILISEKEINYYTATDLPPKNFPITHFDMWAAEDMGLHKYDILSQRGLGHIKDTISLVKQNTGQTVEIIFEKIKEDPQVRENIKTGNTIGCFYIESPAMRMLLKKLRCQDYKTLVAASSIIRPGVAQSGMMNEYINRFHKPETIKYLHPLMEEMLKETFGVMVYQEDVIKVAHYIAGLDLGEADLLRRAMSGKYKGKEEMDKVKRNFINSCRKQGHPDDFSNELWRQIQSFSGYSFCKAHSASFAVESYESLYLKTYYPREFMTAVINNFGGFYSTEFYFHEARMSGAETEPPCVNNSDYYTTIIGNKIYTGFIHLRDFEQKIGEAIPLERETNGPYRDLYDFIKRIPLSLEQLNILIRIGSFRFTGKTKKVLLMDAALHFSKSKSKVPGAELFQLERKELVLPPLSSFSYEDAFDQFEILGFPLCMPFDLLPQNYTGDISADEMLHYAGKQVTMLGYFIATKDLYTVRNELMSFMHFIDKKGKSLDTIHFPPSLQRYPLKGQGFYMLKGKVTVEFGYPSLEVNYMQKLPMVKKEVIREHQ